MKGWSHKDHGVASTQRQQQQQHQQQQQQQQQSAAAVSSSSQQQPLNGLGAVANGDGAGGSSRRDVPLRVPRVGGKHGVCTSTEWRWWLQR